MKRLMTLLTIAFICLSLFSTLAEAKRLGGGSSFGKQRAVPTRQAQQAPAPAPAPAAPAAPGGNRWLGPLAGLAIGTGLGAMFAGGGLGGSMGPILLALLAAGVLMFLFRRFSQPPQPAVQYAGYSTPAREPAALEPRVFGGGSAAASTAGVSNIPSDFPTEQFVRNAKTSFIRLQAANDRKDLDDIREYTTPEVFAEIALQLQERGDAQHKTDVLAINAELLEVVTEGDFSIASVRFAGQLRENNGTPENVDEIWHVQKDLRNDRSVWLLAGIQQVAVQ